MQSKRRTGTVVTESAAQSVLRRGPARELAPDEERVMRMRLGASLPGTSLLERLATATDAEIDLLAYELEAYLRLRATPRAAERERAPAPPARPPVHTPVASRTKEKIARALRKKP